VASGPPSAKFAPLAQTSGYATGHNKYPEGAEDQCLRLTLQSVGD